MEKTIGDDIKKLIEAMTLYMTSMELFKASVTIMDKDNVKSRQLLDMSIRSLQTAKKNISEMKNAHPEISNTHKLLEKDILNFKQIYFPSLS